MKRLLKRVACMSMAALIVVSLGACEGKGDASDVMAQASDPNVAKEAVFKEVALLDPSVEWFDEVLVDGNEVIVVWSEYEDNASDVDMEEEIVPYVEEPEGIESEITEEETVSEEVILEEEILDEDVVAEDVEDIVTEDGIFEDIIIDDDMMVTPEFGYPDEDYHYTMSLNFGRMDFGTTAMSTTTITLPQDEYSSKILVDPNNGNYIVVSEYGEDDYSDPDNYVYKQYYYINTYSQDGTLISREELPIATDDANWYGLSDIVIDAAGDILVSSEYMLTIFNSSLQQIASIELSEGQWISDLFVTDEGTPYVYTYTEGMDTSESNIYVVDVVQGKLGAEAEMPEEFWGGVRTGAGHDMYYSTDKGICVYDFDTKENKMILNFVDSDIDYNYFGYFVPIDETHIAAMINSPDGWEAQISFLEKVPPEEVVDKTIITMGMVYTDYDIRSKVIDFNKASDKYRIRLIEYYQYNNEADWDAGMKTFNNDIITSNAPDIIVIDSGMPIDSFMEKGVLLNLNQYIESDPDISKEDMAPNVLALGSKGDDTYVLTGSFMVSTMTMKESLVPNGKTLTLEELKQLEAQNGNVKAFAEATQEDIIRYALEMNYAEFLDLETGKCAFNTPAFYELLEYAKTYPEEIDWDNMDDSYWEEYQYVMRENKAFLQYCSLGALNYIAYTEQGTYGEEVAFVGFPGTQGVTGVIYPYTQMAISADCENPDAAWDFMRQFYTYDVQKEIGYGLPVHLKALDDMLVKAQERPYWIDEDGNKVEYDDTYWLGDKEIVIKPLTAERTQEIKEYVLSVDKLYYYDSSIVDIIIEEASPFFAGQKTAEQAADIIQSRVQIYVNENQ